MCYGKFSFYSEIKEFRWQNLKKLLAGILLLKWWSETKEDGTWTPLTARILPGLSLPNKWTISDDVRAEQQSWQCKMAWCRKGFFKNQWKKVKIFFQALYRNLKKHFCLYTFTLYFQDGLEKKTPHTKTKRTIDNEWLQNGDSFDKILYVYFGE